MWGANLLLVGRKGFHSREAGNGCNHHAGKELHGGDILIIEGVRGCGEYLEYSQGPLKLAERCRQDGAHSQAAASCQVHLRIVFSVVAEYDFAFAQTFRGNTRVCLQADPDIGSGPARARQMTSFPFFSAMAAPVALVRDWARSVITPIAGSRSILEMEKVLALTPPASDENVRA